MFYNFRKIFLLAPYIVDMMKRNKGVGAACGRIHPTGNSYIAW